MKTKKILCTLMAVMCMGTAALTGCGSDSNSSTANSRSTNAIR
jgi:ABC-type oligopeptide transport system substrate-binding subunit